MFHRFRMIFLSAVLLLVGATVVWAWIPGRFTGGGFYFQEEQGTMVRISNGFELHCQTGAGIPPAGSNNLEVNWGNGNRFHLDTLTFGGCTAEHMPSAPPPGSGFSDFYGHGYGTYNGVPGAFAEWHFDDEGEPGINDHVYYMIIFDPDGNAVLTASGAVTLSGGNFQAHK